MKPELNIHRRTRLAVVVLLWAGLTAATPAADLQTGSAVPLSALWEAPANLPNRDLYIGEWGPKHAPRPDVTYTFLRRKTAGVNPGVVVRDPEGQVWHVKQAASGGGGPEGPAEVALSRVLAAVGYHQPPLYYLDSFKMSDSSGIHNEPGGRFRLEVPSMKARGEWQWTRNPFTGTQPFRGLLVMLLVFNSWDLKDSNNTLYEVHRDGQVAQWYVVRDLGGAMGDSGRFFVNRNDINEFEKHPFIDGVENGYVKFDYHGKQPELMKDRITVDDVRWATNLLGQLSDAQWRDAFRAGGYNPALADRFIRKIKANIALGQQLAGVVEHTRARR